MRTIVAPLHPSVRSQLEAMPAHLARIADSYLRRLELQPYLGAPFQAGQTGARALLHDVEARRIRFDEDSRPRDLFGDHRGHVRRADEDLSAGPAWRIVYRPRIAARSNVLLIEVLAIGMAHPDSGPTVYDNARAVLRAQKGA